MGIEEKNEWVLDLVIEEFSNLSGMYGGVDSDIVVYNKNRAKLIAVVSNRLHLKSNDYRGLMTLGDFVYHFIGLLDKKQKQRNDFCVKIQKTVQEISGKLYDFDEAVYNDLAPTSKDAAQHLREEIHQALKIGKLRNKLLSIYGISCKEEALYAAKTIRDFANVFFWQNYRAD